MTTLYMRTPNAAEGGRLIDEFLQQGFERGQLHVYGQNLPGGLPVEATRWRSASLAILPGAVVGAVLLPMLWLVLFATPSENLVLLLATIGAAIGGGWSLWHERHKPSPLNAQQQAMRRGELMIAAEVPAEGVSSIEQRITESHPEVSLLGPDPAGTQTAA